MKLLLSLFIAVAVLLSGNPVAAADRTVFIQQDFSNASQFTAGKPTIALPATGGTWTGFDGKNFSIASTDAGPALKITRHTSGMLTVTGASLPPANRDITVRLRVRPGAKDESHANIRFFNRQTNTTVVDMRFELNNSLSAYVNGKRHLGLKTAPDQWQEITFTFSPNSETFTLSNKWPDGKVVAGLPLPYENQLPIDTIQFITMVSQTEGKENTIHFGEVVAAYDNVSSLAGRENILLSAYDTQAHIELPDGTRREAPRLIDGDATGTSLETIEGVPSILLFDLPQSTLVSTIRLYTGNADYATNPSGEAAVTEFVVEGMSSASGQWRELLRADDAPGFAESGAEDNASFYFMRDFTPLEVSQLRVTLLNTNDTGRRADPAARPAKTAIMREVELFTHEATATTRQQLNKVLEAEFALPAYSDQDIAQLHAILDHQIADGIEVEVSVRERHTGAIPNEPRRVRLVPGENRIDFNIADWDTGEYRAQLRASGQDAPVAGTIGRLLRINRVEQPKQPDVFSNFTGQKMLFPDDWYLASHADLSFELVPPEAHRVGRTFLNPDKVVQLGSGIGFSSNGKLVVTYRDMNRTWDAASSENHYATADLADLATWDVQPGKPTDMQSAPSYYSKHPIRIGRGGTEFSEDDLKRFRFYDAATDGPVNLREIEVHYVGYKAINWGVVQAPPQSTWLLWKKGAEWLILQNKPFLQDNISAEEFELPTNSNDNFAGQWLSDDGTTYYYVRGRLLKRYPPFVARYDNLWQAARILTVFTTNDGLNWKQNYFPLPDEADGPTAQHYGANIVRVPDANGLMVAYALPYSAVMQQMHIEVYYSWDGQAWHRVQGHKPWIPPGKPGEWNFGLTNLHAPAAVRDGVLYHLIGWGAEIPHFGGEINFKPDEMAKLDGAYLERRYGARGLTDWPYFSHYGSYDKLADALRGYGITPGVMVHRVDGWWALTAGQQEGRFTTRNVQATGTLAVNARIADGGYIAISLADANGKPIDGYSARLESADGIALPVFDHLPTEPFQVVVHMKQAELFTLHFQ